MLQLLSALWQDDARWQANVRDSVGDGYTLAMNEDESGYKTREFAHGELMLADTNLRMYDFAGSATEDERFYGRDETLYEDKDGNIWVMYYDGIDEF
jgi:hypothetical protein